ncbi:MAG TPA: hypothetical protein VHC97_20305 [Thermoanaerobaculia bacterium]|jgi:hypothetical protein|nr:hypothetical protein [Thermoanaerobaculia bacterium]
MTRRRQILALAMLLLASPLPASGSQELPEPWGPERATGAPDTPEAEDAPTAWCSLEPDAGMEWLLVHFEKKVSIAEVRVRESWNPGAVARVSAVSEDGSSSLLWEGRDPTARAPDDLVVRVAGKTVAARAILIEMDTARRPGWNAIDAVELVGRDGSRQWASGTAASSTYADVGGLLAAEYAPEARFFADAALGIRMKAPGWWIRANPALLEAPGKILRAWTKDGRTAIAVTRQETRSAWSAEETLERTTAALGLLGAEVQAREVHEFGGLSALGLVAAGTGEDGEKPGTKQHWVVVPREKDVLLFLLSAPEPSFAAAEQIFEKMLASLEIEGPRSKDQPGMNGCH